MMDFLIGYLISGGIVSLIGALIITARGEDCTLFGFILDAILWPVLILYFIGWLVYNWSENK